MKQLTVLRAAMALVCVTPLGGCSSNRSSAEQLVRENLKDPESARFGEFYFNSETKKACLTVNAKNSMGGYTGDKEVTLTKGDDGWSYEGEEEISHAECKETFADKP